MLKQLAVILGILICLGPLKNTADVSYRNIPSLTDTSKTVLFVGNSLTYTNDLPALVAGIGKDSGISIGADMLAFPNYAIEDHWNDGKLQKMLDEKHYDFVVIQQGPSSQSEGREMLMDYSPRVKKLCNRHGSKLALFMVWPSVSNFRSFDGVIKNYGDAAIKTNSLLCPVGKAWKEYIEKTGDYSYYGPDMFHPSLKGSEVAAMIIFQTLFGKKTS